MSSTKSPVLKLVEEIIAADPGVRFASIIDKNGDVVEGIMNSGKTNLKSQQEEEYFCKQVAKTYTCDLIRATEMVTINATERCTVYPSIHRFNTFWI